MATDPDLRAAQAELEKLDRVYKKDQVNLHNLRATDASNKLLGE